MRCGKVSSHLVLIGLSMSMHCKTFKKAKQKKKKTGLLYRSASTSYAGIYLYAILS